MVLIFLFQPPFHLNSYCGPYNLIYFYIHNFHYFQSIGLLLLYFIFNAYIIEVWLIYLPRDLKVLMVFICYPLIFSNLNFIPWYYIPWYYSKRIQWYLSFNIIRNVDPCSHTMSILYLLYMKNIPSHNWIVLSIFIKQFIYTIILSYFHILFITSISLSSNNPNSTTFSTSAPPKIQLEKIWRVI